MKDAAGTTENPGSERRWWLDSGLARLAFGSRAAHGAQDAGATTMHLAFLPMEALELDLDDPAQRDFGDYELLEQIGQGGMGVVYRARQKSLEREVALKLLSAGPWASEEFVAGFRREAQNAASLQHPNIVTVYGIGEQDGLIFYAMELVRGQSLAQYLHTRNSLPAREAGSLLRTVAEAVDYAHRLGVLHLDMKPGNILLDEHGVAHVADFGLARRLGQASSLENEQISGTPSYMAPEQAHVRNARLSPATDIWGIGAILYEVLTGTPPFVGDSPQDILKLVISGVVRNPGRYAAVPRDLEAICLKCLNKEQSERYASARDLADDLGRFLEGRAVQARPLNALQRTARWTRREPKLAIASGLAVATLVAGLVTTSLQSRRADRNAKQTREQLWQQRIDDASDDIREHGVLDALPAMVSNLAEQEAVGSMHAARLSRVRIAALLGEAPVLVDEIAIGEEITAVALDPAGKWVAAAGYNDRVRLFDLATGTQRWMANTRGATGFWTGPTIDALEATSDGRWLIARGGTTGEAPLPSGQDEILINVKTGALHMPPTDKFPNFVHATFSPDGTYAIVHSRSEKDASGNLESQLFSTADWRAISHKTEAGTWLLAKQATSVARVVKDWTVLEVLDPRSLVMRHRYTRPGASTVHSWRYSNDGNKLALGYGDGHTAVLNIASGKVATLHPQPASGVRSLHFSDDDAWLAAASVDGSISVFDLATGALLAEPMRLEGSLPTVTLDSAGYRLFASNDTHARVWKIPVTPGPAVRMFDRPGYPRPVAKYASVMHLQQRLMASGAKDGALRLWRYHERTPLPGTGPPLRMSEANQSGDGRHAITVIDDTISVMDVHDLQMVGPAIRYPQAVGFATLTPDGKTLIATAGRHVYAHSPHTGRPRFAAIALAASPNTLLVSPRGDLLVVAYNAHDGQRNVLMVESLALDSGARHGRIAIERPDALLRFAEDGATLLVWHLNVLHALDANTLKPRHSALRQGPDLAKSWMDMYRGKFDPQSKPRSASDGVYIQSAGIAKGARTLWLAATGTPASILQAVDAQRGTIRSTRSLPSMGSVLLPLRGERVAVMLPEQDQVRIYGEYGADRALSVSEIDPYPGLALSGDRRRLVVGLRQGVQVFDADSGDWLTPPLRVIPASDQSSGFSTDVGGESVLLRSRAGRTWDVDLEADARPVVELTRLAALLRPGDDVTARAVAPPLDARTRASLRTRDPGTSAPSDKAPIADRTVHAQASSPAQAHNADRFVDLRDRCNTELATSDEHNYGLYRFDRVFPPGRHRLLGIDFDIRCAVIASQSESLSLSRRATKRIAGIDIAQPHAEALDVLMTGGTMFRERETEPYAIFELTYRDGTRERLPVIYRRQVWEAWHWFGEAPGARLAYVGLGSRDSEPAHVAPRIYAVRLLNPHPGRALRSLAIEAVDRKWSQPIVLAITLSPPKLPPSKSHVSR